MNLRSVWKAAKWIGAITGYILGSLAISVILSFLYLNHLCNGQWDDAPGTGFVLIFIAILFLIFFFTIGFFFLVEILYCRIFSKSKIRWLRLLLREVLGLLSLVRPVGIQFYWPLAAGYRSKIGSRPMEILIDILSVVLFLIAVLLPFRFRRCKTAGMQEDD
jgi:CBS domain containing-hemolysin-like protein